MITNFVIMVTNFVIMVTNFVIMITKFDTIESGLRGDGAAANYQ
jgi:hypothetical protein